MQKTAHGRNAGAGGDEDGVGDGLAEGEKAIWSVDLDCAAHGEIGKIGEKVGEEAAFDTIQAEIEAVVSGADAME